MEGPSLTERLAERLARPVDAATRARARLHLLDWLGCVGGALRSEVATVARAAEPDPLTRAALMGNVLEMDDVHRTAILHPGPVVWPAALSAARDRGATMAALLDGAVRGYEAMTALGESFDARHYAYYHNTSTAGGFGAAAAAAGVFGLDAAATADALGNAASVAGGLWAMRHEPCLTKQLHVAHAALHGLWCARLAAAGFTGPKRVLEGDQGLYVATCAAPRLERWAAGEGWRLHEVSFKPYAACRHAHAAIDAALALPPRALTGGAPIRIETYADAVRFCDRPEPRSEVEAKFSLQHAVALVAVRGAVTLDDFGEAARADPALAAVRGRVAVAVDPALDAAYPAHFGARVSASGAAALAEDALGDPERPLSRDALIGKARALFAHGGAAATGERLIALALDSAETAAAASMVDAIAELVGTGWRERAAA